MTGIFRYFAFFAALGALMSAAVLTESAAQTKGKTPLQQCNEKYANVKGVAKSNVILACVAEMTKGK